MNLEILFGVQDLHPVDLEFRLLRPEAGMAQHIAVRRETAQLILIDKGELVFIQWIGSVTEAKRVEDCIPLVVTLLDRIEGPVANAFDIHAIIPGKRQSICSSKALHVQAHQ